MKRYQQLQIATYELPFCFYQILSGFYRAVRHSSDKNLHFSQSIFFLSGSNGLFQQGTVRPIRSTLFSRLRAYVYGWYSRFTSVETPQLGLGAFALDGRCHENFNQSGFGTRVGRFSGSIRPYLGQAACPKLPMLPLFSEMERSFFLLSETRYL